MPIWKVNSYGYPNPFGGRNARRAWQTFESFRDGASYREIKDEWGRHPARPLSAHSVESWKSAFEEFGLLYVLTGGDEVHVTPGGAQIVSAADAGSRGEFAWIGLNLLFRIPLRGKAGRRPHGREFERSDLLLYWFLLAAFVELGHLWQSEYSGVIARVFMRDEMRDAIELVQALRRGDAPHPDPVEGMAAYNVLNQAMVHGSLNHLVFTSHRETNPRTGEAENRWALDHAFVPTVRAALGVPADSVDVMSAMPAIPDFGDDERAYFDYLGAAVPDGAPVSDDALPRPRSEGVPYRRARPSPVAGDTIVFAVDPDRVDRGTAAHVATQNSLSDAVRSAGLEPRSPSAADPQFDVAWTSGSRVFVAEVKSVTPDNETRQLRYALGQVLSYAHLLDWDFEDVTPVLAVEQPPSDSYWLDLCDSLGVALVWPETFATLFADPAAT